MMCPAVWAITIVVDVPPTSSLPTGVMITLDVTSGWISTQPQCDTGTGREQSALPVDEGGHFASGYWCFAATSDELPVITARSGDVVASTDAPTLPSCVPADGSGLLDPQDTLSIVVDPGVSDGDGGPYCPPIWDVSISAIAPAGTTLPTDADAEIAVDWGWLSETDCDADSGPSQLTVDIHAGVAAAKWCFGQPPEGPVEITAISGSVEATTTMQPPTGCLSNSVDGGSP